MSGYTDTSGGDEFIRMRRPDARPIYPVWCLIFAHRWERKYYTWPLEWEKPRSCRRCRHIPKP